MGRHPRDIIGGLRPGRTINIPPFDGAFITIKNERSITNCAQEFRVDPYVIINLAIAAISIRLTSITPDTLLPSAAHVGHPRR